MTRQQPSEYIPTAISATSTDESKSDDELIVIIDETGEGFQFDFTPEAMAKPLGIGTASLFSLGMLSGIPFGLAMGRTQEAKRVTKKVVPTLDGLKFAAGSFGLGTLMCGAMGAAAFYGIKTYYEVDSFQEFGEAMRKSVPERREKLESGFGPMLNFIRRNATENLPRPVVALRDRFRNSSCGKWIREQIAESVTGNELPHDAEDDTKEASIQSSPP